MLQCKTVSGILTPWSFLLLVSVLPTERSTNRICARLILCFAGCCVPLLGHLVTWMSHETLHHWKERVNFFTARHGLKTWSAVCLGQYWKFGNYVSNLPGERWVVRALNWFPENARRVGRPAYTWDSMIQQFCRHNQLGNWRQRAQDTFYWMNQLDEFISFTESWRTWNV